MADPKPVTDAPVVDPDEFKDALEEEDVDSEVTFEVTKEELSICRAQLASDFPDDYNYLSDTYILSVASKPYSKDPSVRRPLEYTMEKLGALMEWRKENAVELLDMLNLAVGPETATEAVEDPSKLTQGKAIVTSLNYSSMYWHGLDKQGRPILWIRCDRMVSYFILYYHYFCSFIYIGIRCIHHHFDAFLLIFITSNFTIILFS